jgi:hypothetical protein
LANPGIPIPAAVELLSRPRHDHALDGSQGSNRSPLPPRVPANNDIEAIDLWLASAVGQRGEPGHNAITESTYRREAERWLMFCLIERHKAMSSATRRTAGRTWRSSTMCRPTGCPGAERLAWTSLGVDTLEDNPAWRADASRSRCCT